MGSGPEHLRGPTLADALKASDAKARVFAVSGKDRSAVLLGGRKADIALWFDRFKGEFTTSSYYRRPSWLAAFNAELRKKNLLPMRDGRVPEDLLASPVYDAALDLLVAALVERESVGRGRPRTCCSSATRAPTSSAIVTGLRLPDGRPTQEP